MILGLGSNALWALREDVPHIDAHAADGLRRQDPHTEELENQIHAIVESSVADGDGDGAVPDRIGAIALGAGDSHSGFYPSDHIRSHLAFIYFLQACRGDQHNV